MGTKNPKISAYVPQEVFDRFKSFQDERGFTMSKAVIAILCDYFDIKETADGLPSGITLAQFQALEKRLVELEDKFESQPIYQNAALMPAESQVIGGSGEVPQLSPKVERIDSYDENPSLPLSYPESEPQKTTSESVAEVSEIESGLFSILSGKDLAKRLSISDSKLSSTKDQQTANQFIEWSKELDPDGIAWTYQKKKKGKGVDYFPVKNSGLLVDKK